MQVSGTYCVQCKARIVLQDEGIWCARCKTTYHKACAPKTPEACLKCGNFEDPTGKFVFSKFCPACVLKLPQKDLVRCPNCQASTRWDDQESYEGRKREILTAVKKEQRWGFIQLLGGLLAMLIILGSVVGPILAAVFSNRPLETPPHFVMGIFGASLVLFANGARKIWRAEKYKKFE